MLATTMADAVHTGLCNFQKVDHTTAYESLGFPEPERTEKLRQRGTWSGKG